ncbi:Coenzyme PQQ synthesis protein E (plasmid) [Cupriavidus taiwanensis]|uniref:PqqA peptide cyclase n=2 Tax=Cupriavidus taiwanensis TaxID=164546 RepID=A0A7Z7JCZ2_9BURK|nr:pyrroloquinoline quinone biosynthesis protein PqqE [Cupriavidus taiwanensis]SOZ10029.1 Quinoprotein ethanol dehydrogenase; PQQ dehydrogenase family [Cupriavidus taiwanensis]SOZ12198.1 Quinoprotein ethanol dehydrogenase; PQQ dehydrogenase family [Cupriavidus taiwanensis]SOZ43503.1 Quinoprotein ethanol dehydrogenase; PQQ dehydrogenase family [Cupriavidus taiwanensis]SPC22745.1 Quinoprotein ethanol dehydrogenase; PQQ dehydrogenase family [Cupriavidus taiwanensis]SPD54255.1 Coenzyme PQQ synthes
MPLSNMPPNAAGWSEPAPPGPPLWLLAELTYRCPLHCAFCSNPVDYARHAEELDTAQWCDVFTQARALGAVQLGLSGGEPLLRKDLETLVRHARGLGFYTNLITSGVGLTDARLAALREAGLDHIQLSFQDSTRELNDFLSSTRTFELKQRVARLIKAHGYPMVMNCVLHRHNLPHVGTIIELALQLGAEYLELANTQYYGWAWENRLALMPTREQLIEAEAVVRQYRARIGRQCQLLFVVPDYFEERPKKCMNGWGTTFLGVAPDGTALPCHAARMLPDLVLPNVKTGTLRDIWQHSDAFRRFRGTQWMPQPCRSCEHREADLGGCRCQAFLVTGDAAATDPACAQAPGHGRLREIVLEGRLAAALTNEYPLVFRSDGNSLRLGSSRNSGG